MSSEWHSLPPSTELAGASTPWLPFSRGMVGAAAAATGVSVFGASYVPSISYTPSNCTLVGQTTEEHPYEKAKSFIKEDTKRNCCNIGCDNSVQRWKLPPGQPKVLLTRARSSTTFFYHDDLLGSENFSK